ncbi:hypothetical protein Q4O60_01720 [Aeribacillus pallidus]|nr:hypothetical protein [Aeribacillus pallidus]
MFSSNIEGAVCYEVKTYRYVVAGRTMAEFEILIFENGQIGSQGKILRTGEGFSPAKIYPTIEDAVQEMINIIEEKISNDEWVRKTINVLKRDDNQVV